MQLQVVGQAVVRVDVRRRFGIDLLDADIDLSVAVAVRLWIVGIEWRPSQAGAAHGRQRRHREQGVDARTQRPWPLRVPACA